MLIVASATFANTDDEKPGMTRRQQGILTGMPFMAHVSARAYVDDTGRRMYFAKPPTRIVSLAPSITEMLFAIEAGEQLVGVTDFCDYPLEALKKPKVGYSNPNLESLVALQPDLVVAPNDFLKPDVIVKLEQLKIPVFILADKHVEGIFAHIQTLGRIVGRSPKADAVAMELRKQVATIQQRIQGVAPVRVLYVLNSQPPHHRRTWKFHRPADWNGWRSQCGCEERNAVSTTQHGDGAPGGSRNPRISCRQSGRHLGERAAELAPMDDDDGRQARPPSSDLRRLVESAWPANRQGARSACGDFTPGQSAGQSSRTVT